MKIFVTGGTGFLGKQVIKKLKDEGHLVMALSRSTNSDQILENLGVSAVRGDIIEAHSFFDALQGYDAVIHCAAPVKFWAPWDEYSTAIVKATANLASAARKNGIRKFIHISSESVLQAGKPLIDIDENKGFPDQSSSFYGEAKKKTEQLLLKSIALNETNKASSKESEMNVIILRPPFIYGPGCHAYEELFTAAKSGMFKWVDGSSHPMEAIHVENLVHAISLSLIKDIDSGVYYVTDAVDSSAKEFFTKLFSEYNVPLPKSSMPLGLLKFVGWITPKIWNLFGIKSKPPLTLFDLEFISLPRRYNIGKFQKATGYQPVV